jgi:hypothetical protein
MVALLDNLLIRAISIAILDEDLHKKQREKPHQIKRWKDKYQLVNGEDHA